MAEDDTVPTQAPGYVRDPRSGGGGSSSSVSAPNPVRLVEVADVASASTSGLASATAQLAEGKDIFTKYEPPVTPPGSVCGSIDIPERGVRNRWRKRSAGGSPSSAGTPSVASTPSDWNPRIFLKSLGGLPGPTAEAMEVAKYRNKIEDVKQQVILQIACTENLASAELAKLRASLDLILTRDSPSFPLVN